MSEWRGLDRIQSLIELIERGRVGKVVSNIVGNKRLPTVLGVNANCSGLCPLETECGVKLWRLSLNLDWHRSHAKKLTIHGVSVHPKR